MYAHTRSSWSSRISGLLRPRLHNGLHRTLLCEALPASAGDRVSGQGSLVEQGRAANCRGVRGVYFGCWLRWSLKAKAVLMMSKYREKILTYSVSRPLRPQVLAGNRQPGYSCTALDTLAAWIAAPADEHGPPAERETKRSCAARDQPLVPSRLVMSPVAWLRLATTVTGAAKRTS